MLSGEVVARILELDGAWDKKSNDLSTALKSLNFATPLFQPDVVPELVGTGELNRFLEETSALRDTYPTAFQGALAGFLESNGRSQYFRWTRQQLFGPDAWDEHGDALELGGLVPGDKLEFLQFSYSTGFPDSWLVCLSDPSQSDPTVYCNDHADSYLDTRGTLLDFFDQLRTPMQILLEHSDNAS